jgi:hypothetical protein
MQFRTDAAEPGLLDPRIDADEVRPTRGKIGADLDLMLTRQSIRRLPWIVFLGIGFATASHAELYSNDKLRVYSDGRGRLESDWDSQRADGSERENRTRLRIRFRVGFEFMADEHLTLNVRLRSGPDPAQQSSNITIIGFDETVNDTRDTGAADFNFDRWYLKYQDDKLWGWIGRNDIPLWKQNELFWDDDATVAGVAGGWKSGAGRNGKLALNAGYFSPPAGMRAFVGNFGLGQVVYDQKVGESSGFTVAPALLYFAADPEDPDAAMLLEGNGARDYILWVLSLQGRLRAAGLPLKLGVDLVTNTRDYPNEDPMDPGSDEQFTYDNRDETDGYVASITFGDLKKKGDWLAAYSYASIETLAVNNSYSQDDWVRWGTSTQTRASNMKAHELRFGYTVGKRSTFLARFYVAEAITTIEDGKRIRIDYSFTF